MCLCIHIHTCIHVNLDRLADVQPIPPLMAFSKLFQNSSNSEVSLAIWSSKDALRFLLRERKRTGTPLNP